MVLVELQESGMRCMCLVHQLNVEAGTSFLFFTLLDPVHFWLFEAMGQVH